MLNWKNLLKSLNSRHQAILFFLISSPTLCFFCKVDLEISHILNASMKASSHTSMDHLLGGPTASPGPRPNPEAAQMRMAAIQGAASMAEGTLPPKGERPVDLLPTPQQNAFKGSDNSGESVKERICVYRTILLHDRHHSHAPPPPPVFYRATQVI